MPVQGNDAAAAAPNPIVLPDLEWKPVPYATGGRGGERVVRVVVHRWGVSYTSEQAEAATYLGVSRYFDDASHQANAHVIFPGSAVPGSAVPGKAIQKVAWANKAWAEAAYNASSDDVESADAIWLGHDPHGLAVLARIVAYRLHARGLPATWSAEKGFCRHADLGAAGGGHTACPTTDLHLWHAFCGLVQHEAARGGFRPVWGR